VLKDNHSVVELNVQKNGLGDEDVKILGELLSTTNVLHKIDLGGNFIGATGLMYLSIGMQYNHSLDELGLSGRLVPSEDGVCPTVCLDERADFVAGALLNTLRRKKELFSLNDRGSFRLHGFMTPSQAEELLKSVKPTIPGMYLLYLDADRPDTVCLVYTASQKNDDLVHRYIYRHNRGYSCTPVVASLARQAAWKLWASGGDRTKGLGQPEEEELRISRELFRLWKCEVIEEEEEQEEEQGAGKDLWEAVYPTLYYFTSSLRSVLKVGLNRKP
jgi:hypothetical protein